MKEFIIMLTLALLVIWLATLSEFRVCKKKFNMARSSTDSVIAARDCDTYIWWH